MTPRRIWMVDDAPNMALIELLLGQIRGVLPGTEEITLFSSDKALEALNSLPGEQHPDILFIDAWDPWSPMIGYDNFKKVVGYLAQARPDCMPEAIGFTSQDEKSRLECRDLAIRSGIFPHPNRIYALDKFLFDPWKLIPLLVSYLAWDDKSDKNDFLRMLEDLRSLTATRSLQLILCNSSKRAYVETLNVHLNENERPEHRIGFHCGYGPSCHGYAAYSVFDAVDLKASGRDPILIVDRMLPEWRSFFSSIKGLIINKATCAHLDTEIYAHGASELIGARTKSEWKRVSRLGRGSKITLDTNDPYVGVYEGHIPLITHTPKVAARNIHTLFRLAAAENQWNPTKVLAVVNAITQMQDVFALGCDGIGLVRSERLIETDPDAFNALYKIVSHSANDNDAHRVLRAREKAHAETIFSQTQEHVRRTNAVAPYPITYRMLCPRPDEIVSPYEAESASKNGAPSLQDPGKRVIAKLYRNQFDAVLPAYKDNGRGIALAFLFPNLRTYSEFQSHKKTGLDAARRIGIPKTSLEFHAMVENLTAVKNIKAIARRADGICIGGNDLTADVTKISRSDIEVSSSCIDPKTGRINPFRTLHSEVIDVITQLVSDAREGNPDICINFCGAQAFDVPSLKALYPLALDSICVPPAETVFFAIAADFGIHDFQHRMGAANPTLSM